MVITDQQIYSWLGSFIFPLFRVAALFMVMPIFGATFVPKRVRLMLALVTTLAILPLLQQQTATFEPFSLQTPVIVAIQILVGALLGFTFQLVFQIFVVGGQLVAMQSGLGFASLVDPQTGVSVPVVSQIYLMMVTLFFLALNGHLLMIQVLLDSFNTIPLDATTMNFDSLWQWVVWGKWLFKGALQMALPAVTALLLVNIAFGIMTKAAPQINIFTIGFPMTMIIGLVVIWLGLQSIFPTFKNMFEQALVLMGGL